MIQGLKLIKYIKYFHKNARVFVYGSFALNIYETLLGLGVDFILEGNIHERLLSLVRNHVNVDSMIFPASENKIELDNYDYTSLDTFNAKSKVKRKLKPHTLDLTNEVVGITQFTPEKIDIIFDELAALKMNHIKLSQFDLYMLTSTPSNANLYVDLTTAVPDLEVITHAAAKFKTVSISIEIADANQAELFETNIDIYKEIAAVAGVKMSVHIHKTSVYPDGYGINFNIAQIKELTKLSSSLSNKKTIKVITDDTLVAWRNWGVDEDALIHALTKYFKL